MQSYCIDLRDFEYSKWKLYSLLILHLYGAFWILSKSVPICFSCFQKSFCDILLKFSFYAQQKKVNISYEYQLHIKISEWN